MRKPIHRAIIGAGVVAFAAGITIFAIRAPTFFSFEEEEQKSPTETTSTLPEQLSNVISPIDVLTLEQIVGARKWMPGNFNRQTEALGWTQSTFDVSDGMKKRVAFWRDIYAKYSTDEGVLHDPVTLDVYEAVTFDPVPAGASLGSVARERKKVVDERKAEISARLLALQERLDKARTSAVTTPFDTPASAPMDTADDLHGDEYKLWKMFNGDSDPQKYSRAASRLRFQLGQRDRFLVGIYYSGRYLASMEKIFREEGLPIELTRLPFVESSFNIHARSKVGASGIWQFMPRTARPYMKVNRDVDERNEPLTATRAAARFMRSNYNSLKSWPLAVTAWNHGTGGVRTVVDKMKTDDIAQITNGYSSRTFGFASQNFYACFLAVLEVESRARKYFASPVWAPEIPTASIRLARVTSWPSIVHLFGDNEAAADDFNPQIASHARAKAARIPAGTVIFVPPDFVDEAPYLLGEKKHGRGEKIRVVAKPVSKQVVESAEESTAKVDPAASTAGSERATPAPDADLTNTIGGTAEPSTPTASIPLTPEKAAPAPAPAILQTFKPRAAPTFKAPTTSSLLPNEPAAEVESPAATPSAL